MKLLINFFIAQLITIAICFIVMMILQPSFWSIMLMVLICISGGLLTLWIDDAKQKAKS